MWNRKLSLNSDLIFPYSHFSLSHTQTVVYANILVWARRSSGRADRRQGSPPHSLQWGLIDAQLLRGSKQTHDNVFILFSAFVCLAGWDGECEVVCYLVVKDGAMSSWQQNLSWNFWHWKKQHTTKVKLDTNHTVTVSHLSTILTSFRLAT